MSFVTKTVRKRFPKSTFALVIVVILLLVAIADMMFLNWAITNWAYQTFIIGTINFIMYAPLQFASGAGLVLVTVGLFMYRRNYGKKKILIQQPQAPLQGGLINTQPLQTPNTGQVIVEEEE